jgi:hypothetical protein
MCQTDWVKWLILKEIAVKPSGFCPTPKSISSTCGTIFTCDTMKAPSSTPMIAHGMIVAFFSAFSNLSSLVRRVASERNA